MNFLKQRIYKIIEYFPREKTVQEQTQFLNKYQIYFEKIYYVISWENSTFTMVIFLISNLFFWFIVQMEMRIFGILFSMILLLFMWDSISGNTEKMYSPNKYLDFFDSTVIIVYDTIYNLKSFRRENPSTFCVMMSLIFLFLRIIARNVSGYQIFYIILLLIFFIPLGLKLLPQKVAHGFKNSLQSLFNIRGILAEEELIPFISDKDFGTRDNDLDSLLSDQTADSVSTSLITGLNSMPSYLDGEDIQNDVQEEDLLPNKNAVYSDSYDISSESDSEHKEINLASSNFSEDTSSEDEIFLGDDIKFNKSIEDDNSMRATMFSKTVSNITTLGNYFLPNVFKFTRTKNDEQLKRQNSDSSSSSDFEFLSKDDIKN